MEIPYPSSVQVEYGMELEDDTVQWALHVSQAGRKEKGRERTPVQLGQVVPWCWAKQPGQQSKQQASRPNRKRERAVPFFSKPQIQFKNNFEAI
jgi:hypothetical protein